MPELPEVQTVCDELSRSLNGRSFVNIEKYREDIRFPIPDLSGFVDKKVREVRRRAKYIVIDTGDSELIIHLGMSGKIMIGEPQERKKHDHVLFALDDGQEMVFNDARRFGLITTDEFSDKLFGHLGPEPFDDEFTVEYMQEHFKKRLSPIKNVIMNQEFVVGVGNIYASEALFRSGVRPARPANKVTKAEIDLLHDNIIEVLNEAIASGGSTLRDYVRSSGDLGYFQHSHKVYGREGEACYTCGAEVKKIVQSGRSSFYCPQCQK